MMATSTLRSPSSAGRGASESGTVSCQKLSCRYLAESPTYVAHSRCDPTELGNWGCGQHETARERSGPAVGAFERRRRAGEQRGAPAAVAARRAEPGDLLLQHDNAQRRIALEQVPRRPQPREPAADDRYVGIPITGEGCSRCQVVRNCVVPEADLPVAVYSRVHASVRTPRRIPSISSNSGLPIVSGGASWMTGSPRSSARQ